tara:strand:- start:2053 stop:2973 length:921 start_codon:yes stop_codon:yes gene_type:complete
MRILVTGRAIPTQPDRCTGQQLAEGFRQAGHECVFYGCFYGEPNNFLGVKEVQGTDFDLVVVTEMNDGMWGYESLFNYYKLKDVPRLYWDFDVSYHPDVSFGRAGKIAYDGYLVGNRFFVDDFAKKFGKPSLLLPYACSPQIHRKMSGVRKESLIGFIGSLTAERKALFEKVPVKHVNGVFGDDLITETNKLYCMLHKNQDACKGLVPGRPWETAGCGTTLFMDRDSYLDFAPFLGLKDDKLADVFVYDNEDEIIEFILDWDTAKKRAELEEMGDRLMVHMHANHTYKNRAEAIIEWSKEQKILKS